ncbi:chromodomain-helicase-DNA-binding protein 8-like [Gymnodraco acuticeps]|uniref:Chromodomain-helicase-DNA-binding protein 8-like n=1 Tax=Gymnodraco acuticeps TaxID=8218 RepID=A0A6P8VHS5_GYMAC|nr:chromodomain-helicase-DNA-binding protein 8-like [Gymnodraco acuticeps]
MLDKASLKLGLDRPVLQSMSGNNNGPVQQFSKKEIEDLLRKGAYAAIMDIDQILQRRATFITITSLLQAVAARERRGGPRNAGQIGKDRRYITEKIMDINKKKKNNVYNFFVAVYILNYICYF